MELVPRQGLPAEPVGEPAQAQPSQDRGQPDIHGDRTQLIPLALQLHLADPGDPAPRTSTTWWSRTSRASSMSRGSAVRCRSSHSGRSATSERSKAATASHGRPTEHLPPRSTSTETDG